MTQLSSPNPDRELQLEKVLADYLHAEAAGRPPRPDDLLAQHPHLADELGSFFRNRVAIERLAEPLRQQVADTEATLAPDPGNGTGMTVRYFGDYELLEEIAKGGMGIVYRARQVSLNRMVALKMILKGEFANEADVRRFRQEAEAAANLDHPNIVPIFEVGEHEGQQYFSMKLINEGVKLDHREPKAAVTLLAKIARAVHHAHQRGILHRDLKPGNILVDERGEPHVTDFGLAKRTASPADGSGADLTRSGAIVGTPSYMAPEQARAEKDLTTVADVYSLGAVLYEWLTGRPPFRGTDPLGTLLLVIEAQPAAPRQLNRKIDRDLETICLKCLEKDPKRRYPSAEALADDLERWLRREPIVARRIGRVRRLARWCRRKPAPAALIFLVLVGSIFVLALIVGKYIEDSNTYYRNRLHWADDMRRSGDLRGARIMLHDAPRFGGFTRPIDPEWRGAAVQLVATAELLPRWEVKIAEQARDEGLFDFLYTYELEWTEAERIRIRTEKEVQIRQAADGELIEKQANGKPLRTALPELPADALVLGRSGNDAWAVLKINPGEPNREAIVLWDVAGKKTLHTLPDVGQVSGSVLISHDGRLMAYVDPFARTTIRLWDWQDQRFVASLNTGIHFSDPDKAPLERAGGFSPDGELLATVGQNPGESPGIFVWQVATGQLLDKVGQTSGVCRWSPDSHWLAIVTIGSRDFRVHGQRQPGMCLQMWELRYPSRSYSAGTAALSSSLFASGAGPTFAPSGEYLGWGDQQWKIGNRGSDIALDRAESLPGSSARCEPDGSRWFIRLDADEETLTQTLSIKRLEPAPLERSLLLPDTRAPAGLKGQGRQVRLVGVAPDGEHALLDVAHVEYLAPPNQPPRHRFTGESTLEWWDLVQGKRLARWTNAETKEEILEIALIADGELAVSQTAGTVKIWETKTGTIRHQWEYPPYSGGFALSTDRRHGALYTNAELRGGYIHAKNTVIDIFDLETGERVLHRELTDWSSLNTARPRAFHLESGWLIAEGKDLELWNLETGKLWAYWKPHEARSFGAALSNDGQLLATWSEGTLRLWPLPQLQDEVQQLRLSAGEP